MKPPVNPHFPRMMFHRTRDPVTVNSQEELDALGEEWSKTIFTGEEEERPEPPSNPEAEPEIPEVHHSANEEPPAESAPRPAVRKPSAPPPQKGKRRGH